VTSQASRSPFSWGLQTRPSTSLQLRLNHFSTLAGLAKRSAFAAGASGATSLPVLACLPVAAGFWVWQEAQLHSPPWVALKNCSPRCEEKPLKPGSAARAAESNYMWK